MKPPINPFVLFVLICSVLWSGCTYPNEFPIPKPLEKADKVARSFIENIVRREADSCFMKMDPAIMNDSTKQILRNDIMSIGGSKVDSIRVVGASWSSFNILGSENATIYNLAYEYKLSSGYMLFRTNVLEVKGKLYIKQFTGNFLSESLKSTTAFRLSGKSTFHYLFLITGILLFLLKIFTLVVVFITKLPARKKITWVLIVLLIAMPRFTFDWLAGELGYQLINISLAGIGIVRSNLYSGWIIFFDVPIGAALFLYQRKFLIQKYNDPVITGEIDQVGNTPIASEDPQA